jgi:hypothetical protein
MKRKRSLIKDTSGLAWVWAMSAITIVLGAVIYFPLSYVWQHLYAYIVADYVFTGDTALGLAAINLLLSYLLAIGLVILINWAIVQSKSENYSG